MSAAISDRRMLKDQRRQPLIAKVKLLKASNDAEDRAKARRIEHNNLRNKKETKNALRNGNSWSITFAESSKRKFL